MINIIRILFLLVFSLSSPAYAENKNSDINSFDYKAFSLIPVLQNGRIKPIDSFARIYLQAFSGKQSVQNITATAWLAELLLSPDKSGSRPVFYISNPDLLSMLGLSSRKTHLYSFDNISEAINKNIKIVKDTLKASDDEKTLAQKQLQSLYEKTIYYIDLSQSLSWILPDFKARSPEVAALLNIKEGDTTTYIQMQTKKALLKEKLSPLLLNDYSSTPTTSDDSMELMLFAYRMKNIEQEHSPGIFLFIPPQWEDKNNIWYTPWLLFQEGQGSPKTADFLDLWTGLAQAYRDNDFKKFSNISDLILSASLLMPENTSRLFSLKIEGLYNDLSLFKYSLGFYIAAFLFLLLGGLLLKPHMNKMSFYFLSSAAMLHVCGTVMRMVIMGRPPVSSLYESVLFVGIVVVLFAIFLERRNKDGSGLMIGAVCGSILQFIGMRYATDGDTMGMLQAVLNTNFWLATHVLAISIGYGACLVSGFISHIYMYRRFMKQEDSTNLSALAGNIKGVALIALFFTTLGTILGGIWADQSWGRFWGWDPKENGALLIVLWLIWIFHGRLVRKIGDDGFAACMIINNVIVALAWFGVNLLGTGLHSYGFTKGIAFNLLLFCAAELFFVFVCFLWFKMKGGGARQLS